MKVTRVINEYQVNLPTLKVKGHVDMILFVEHEGQSYILIIDIKTINKFSYKKKFGRKPDPNPSNHHELQLSTYALAIEKEFGQKGNMYLVYYCKDDSRIKVIKIKRDMLDHAIKYWEDLNKSLDKWIPNGLDPLEEGISPMMKWECSYCKYKTKCEADEIMLNINIGSLHE